MDNYHIFIIWNKALWCRERIINDINASFDIIKDVYIKWNKDKFPNNLLAFYGRKLGEPLGKIISSGKDRFELIVVKDRNPNYQTVKTYDSEETINTNVYKKKQLYRSWTAGSHRIHSSDSDIETKHDLTVLLGPNYKDVLNKYNNRETIEKDTIGVEGFQSLKDVTKSLELFNNNHVDIINDSLIIFCKCRYDIVKFLQCKKENNQNTYTLKIKDEFIKIYIFGELDGDLLNYSFNDLLNPEIRKDILENFEDFLNKKRNYIDVERKDTFFNKYTVIKNEIKLLLTKK